MSREIKYHSVYSHHFAWSCDPFIVQMVGIYIFNDMGNMQKAVFPQLNQGLPIFILIILDTNPSVIIPKSCIIRKDQRYRLVLKLSLIHISEPTRQAEISYAVFC